MTDAGTLQVSLAVLGGLVLAGVVAYGAWTSRKNEPKQPTQIPSNSPLENSLSTIEHPSEVHVERESDVDVQAGNENFLDQRLEPHFGTEPALSPDPAALSTIASLGGIEKIPRLDALLDAIASISLNRPVSGEIALAAMPSTRRAGSKQFAFEGLNAQSSSWEFPIAGEVYLSIQCGVQLANRNGALNPIEFSEFVVKVQAVADSLGGDADFPDMLEAVACAKELDQFASAHDAQLSFTLRALKAAWSPGYVQQCASRLGFATSVIPGRMVMSANLPNSTEQVPLLTLQYSPHADVSDDLIQGSLRELLLVLDVPQVHRELNSFPQMCDAALALANAMDGEVVDDKGNRIQAQAMESIYTDLAKLYDALEARHFSAGTPLARRLFS